MELEDTAIVSRRRAERECKSALPAYLLKKAECGLEREGSYGDSEDSDHAMSADMETSVSCYKIEETECIHNILIRQRMICFTMHEAERLVGRRCCVVSKTIEQIYGIIV